MSGGDVQKLVATLITTPVIVADPIIEQPDFNTLECTFEEVVLADTIGSDDLKNDRSSDFFQQGLSVSGSALFLEKKIGGAWSEVATLDDDTLGTFYPFGFWSKANQFNSIGFVIEWTKVLQDVDLGEGLYRIRCDHSTISGGTVAEYGCERRLCLYTPERSEETIRFTYYLNGLHGNVKNRTQQINFGDNIQGNNLGWFNQIRVGGFFGFETRSMEQEFRQFKNKAQQILSNTQTANFTAILDNKFLDMHTHHHLMQMFQSSWCFVTDYNQTINPDKYVDFAVNPVGNYEPEYFRGNKNSKVTLEFEQKYNTFKWKPC